MAGYGCGAEPLKAKGIWSRSTQSCYIWHGRVYYVDSKHHYILSCLVKKCGCNGEGTGDVSKVACMGVLHDTKMLNAVS